MQLFPYIARIIFHSCVYLSRYCLCAFCCCVLLLLRTTQWPVTGVVCVGILPLSFYELAVAWRLIIVHTSSWLRSMCIEILFSTMYHTCPIDRATRHAALCARAESFLGNLYNWDIQRRNWGETLSDEFEDVNIFLVNLAKGRFRSSCMVISFIRLKKGYKVWMVVVEGE